MHLGETTFSIDFIENLYCSLLHTNYVNMTIPNGHILRIWVTWLAVIYRTIRPLIRRCCAESGAWAQNSLDLHAVADFVPRMRTCWEVMMSWDSYFIMGNSSLEHHVLLNIISALVAISNGYPMPYDLLDLLHIDDWCSYCQCADW
jgi:hypothetical protein